MLTFASRNSSSVNEEDDVTCLLSFCRRRLSFLLLVIVVVLSLIFVCVVSCLFVEHRRRRSSSSKSFFKWICQALDTKKKTKTRSIPSLEEEEEEERSMLKCEETKTIDVVRLSFEKSSLVGRGRCCDVYSGQYGEEKVAIKMFHQSTLNESIHSLFEREKEIYSLPSLSHLNLLRFFGCVTIDRCECLILQFAGRGSLKEYLREHPINDEEQLISFSRQIANALEYLHQDCSTGKKQRRTTRFPVAHRDVKSENILLDVDGERLFLADLSMSIEINREDSSRPSHQQVGTPRYMSPEILAGTIGNEWNDLLKCDIYALGIVFWELLSTLKSIGQLSLLLSRLSIVSV